jgi:hypothetical protein
MDKHGAWQREFTLLLKIFSQWLKERGMRTSEVLQTIARLQHIAQREPATIALVTASEALRLRMVHALCLPPIEAGQAITPKSLQCSGLRTWTFDPTLPMAVQVGVNKAEDGNPDESFRHRGQSRPKTMQLDFTSAAAMRQALDEARSLNEGTRTDYLEHDQEKTNAEARLQNTDTHGRQSGLGSIAWRINLHRAEYQNELCIHECPVYQLGREELRALKPYTQQASHYLWLVDAASFDPELETLVYFSLLREGLQKGKTLWLVVYGAASQTHHLDKTDSNPPVDPVVKDWAIGLGLTAAQMLGLRESVAEALDARPITEQLHKSVILSRRMRWRTDMHECIAQLQKHATAPLEALETDRQTETEKRLEAKRSSEQFVEKARRQAATTARDAQDRIGAINAIREAQLSLRSKVWAALDKANEAIGSTKAPSSGHTATSPEQLRLQLLQWFDIGRHSVDSADALLRAGAIVFAKEFQKISTEKIAEKLLLELPRPSAQVERLAQHKTRCLGHQSRWDALTMPQAYEKARIAQIALDSIVESTRSQATEWFAKALAVIDAQAHLFLQKQQRNAALLETVVAAQYQIGEPQTRPLQSIVNAQKTKLDEQIGLLNAAVMDALPMPTESKALASAWIDIPQQVQAEPKDHKVALKMTG